MSFQSLVDFLAGSGREILKDTPADDAKGQPREVVFQAGQHKMVAVDAESHAGLHFRINVTPDQAAWLAEEEERQMILVREATGGRNTYVPRFDGDPLVQNLRMLALLQQVFYPSDEASCHQRLTDAMVELTNAGIRILMFFGTAEAESALSYSPPEIDPADPAFH